MYTGTNMCCMSICIDRQDKTLIIQLIRILFVNSFDCIEAYSFGNRSVYMNVSVCLQTEMVDEEVVLVIVIEPSLLPQSNYFLSRFITLTLFEHSLTFFQYI